MTTTPTEAAARELARMIEAEHSTRNARRADTLELVAFLDHLRAALADRIDRNVITARAQGAQWEEVGRALGVTKQAAHKRHRSR